MPSATLQVHPAATVTRNLALALALAYLNPNRQYTFCQP